MRLIDADELELEAFGIWVHGSLEAKYRMNALKDLIDQAPTVDAAPKWIRIEDGLPEDDVNVLVYAIGNNENDIIAMTSYTHNMYGYNNTL